MRRRGLTILLSLITLVSSPQEKALKLLLSDPSMTYGSVSLSFIDAVTGETIFEHDPHTSLNPASVMKLITSAAALEMLGPGYSFSTQIGYTGNTDPATGRLNGDIVIKGGGDPALGSEYFSDHYGDFMGTWIAAAHKSGIKSIDGSVITDDSYYDFHPVPAKWLWEDLGNYYGAGAFGLSLSDNTYEIHLRTGSENSEAVITAIVPEECRSGLSNRLISSGNTDRGYVYAAPYSSEGWIAGSVPVNRSDFILRASVTDPPLLAAKILDRRLRSAGISISGQPSTVRVAGKSDSHNFTLLAVTLSPPLSSVINVMNRESSNLYAEHLVKELGKSVQGDASATSGMEVIKRFIGEIGVSTDGMFLEDGSGLSPLNAVSAGDFTGFLYQVRKRGSYFPVFYSVIPKAGSGGTLSGYFRDPVFAGKLRAKSGSMTRVKNFAGYITSDSGREMAFTIFINNFTGSSLNIVRHVEAILKETIIQK